MEISVWHVGEIALGKGTSTIGKLNETQETAYFGPPSVPIIQTGVVTGLYGDGEVFSHSISIRMKVALGPSFFCWTKTSQHRSTFKRGDFGKPSVSTQQDTLSSLGNDRVQSVAP
jgi:hypothetical protein